MNKYLSHLIALLFIAFLTTSCGLPVIGDHVKKKSGTVRLFSSTDASFAPYVSSFEAYAKVVTGHSTFTVGDVPINFGVPEDTNFQGVCYIYSNNAREIIIRKDWWDTASDSDKESLIFHELGHCRLDREHDDEVMVIAGRSVKLSMMHHVIVTGQSYSEKRSSYIDELFTTNKTPVIQAFSN